MKTKIIISLLLIGVFGVGFVLALDPPHDTSNSISCASCHIGHTAAGAAQTVSDGLSNLCLSCHTAGDPINTKPFEPSDQAVMGVSGNSHSWSGLLVNTSIGTQDWPPADPIRIDRSDPLNPKLLCSSCHDQHHHDTRNSDDSLNVVRNPYDPTAPAAGTPTSPDGRHFMRMANDTAQLCRECHQNRDLNDATDAGNPRKFTGDVKSHPVRVTLPAADPAFNPTPLDLDGSVQSFEFGSVDSVGGGSQSLDDVSQSWGNNALQNMYVTITSGTASGTTRQITGNDSNTISWSGGITGLAIGDTYEVDMDGNPSNDMRLDSANQVQCLTCHGVHNADSDGTTYDGF